MPAYPSEPIRNETPPQLGTPPPAGSGPDSPAGVARHRRASISRRRLLTGSLALGGALTPLVRDAVATPPGGGWTLRSGAEAAAATGDCAPPPDLPAGIETYRRAYRNWAGEIAVDDVWTCAPATTQDVVALANWANRQGYTLRAQGFRHGWSPLTIPPGDGCPPRVLLVDTTANLTGISVNDGPVPTVRAQAGADMETLLGRLEAAGYGLTATPAPGDLSIGGVLAIGAHGTAVPARGETGRPGTSYGSLSDLVVSLTAVVWDGRRGRYVARTIGRSEPGATALLTNLGRAFVTEVTLRVGRDTTLRCLSRTDIPAAELFGAPGSGGRTLDTFLDAAGRAEAIWFAFTDLPWLKVWSVAPTRPVTSRPVTGPYNYPFSDNVPEPVAVLAGRITAGAYPLAPVFGQAQYAATVAGLASTASADIWGPSKNLLLYVRPTTLRVHANGYAVLARRDDVQRVVHEFTSFYQRLLSGYAERGSFPVNGAVEIRVTGVESGTPAPALSAVTPVPDRPEWNVAVWLDVLTLPGTPDAHAFLRDLERFIFDTYDGSWALARVEWSKGWAYTGDSAWADPDVLGRVVPASLPAWDAAVAALDRYDPHRVFSNPFLDRLLR